MSCAAPHLGPLMYAIKLKCGAELVAAAKRTRGARAWKRERERVGERERVVETTGVVCFFFFGAS